jgi:phage shock protein A
MVREARDIFRSATKRAEEAETAAKTRIAEYDAKTEQLHDREQQLEQRETTVEDELQKVTKGAQTLQDAFSALTLREDAVRTREANAEAGFITQRHESLKALEQATLGYKRTDLQSRCRDPEETGRLDRRGGAGSIPLERRTTGQTRRM